MSVIVLSFSALECDLKIRKQDDEVPLFIPRLEMPFTTTLWDWRSDFISTLSKSDGRCFTTSVTGREALAVYVCISRDLVFL